MIDEVNDEREWKFSLSLECKLKSKNVVTQAIELTHDKFNFMKRTGILIETHIGATIILMNGLDLEIMTDLIGWIGCVTRSIGAATLPNNTRRMQRRTRFEIPIKAIMRDTNRCRAVHHGKVIIDRDSNDGDKWSTGWSITVARRRRSGSWSMITMERLVFGAH